MASQVKRVKLDDFTEGISEFALHFHQECVKSMSGNVIISPLSVATALTLLSQGTNESFVCYKLEEHFKEIAVEKFSSGIESLDFKDSDKSARIINDFVEENTNQMIKDFIKPGMCDADTRLILVNAIYFKGTWEYKFNKNETREGDFWINEIEKNRVEFMTMEKCMQYGKLKDLDAVALEMKYADSKLSFLIILPNSRTGLSALEKKMKNYKLKDIISKMKLTTCCVTIPKFKVEFEIDLKSVLKELGMSEMFDKNNANLTDLIESKEQLYVSDAIHKAIIEVDEDGSKAVAATGMRVMCCSGGPVEYFIPFRADHAFLFHIIDKESNSIIFSGRSGNLKM
ncbi:ovalbumin-related protein X-like [Contarinia nasturtii]|uniref:ovalbumin-related protein X-like n=1 Tax=Contarinia nasturtii TaxID=265458 RepID=UPI0012D44ACA|nr:ovalbumin-related protein X-like [Contarinia nasturtii]